MHWPSPQPLPGFLAQALDKTIFHHVAFSITAGSRSILPVCGDVGNYSLGESHFLNLARHRAQIDQQAVHFRHPYKWIAADQAGKRPLQVEYPYLEGLLDDPRLGVEVLSPTPKAAQRSAVVMYGGNDRSPRKLMRPST